MTRNNGPRFTDSKDFDEVHDTIMADVIRNPVRYIESTLGGWPIRTPIDTIGDYQVMREQRYNIIAEQEFHGVFPDIRLEISASFNHYLRVRYHETGYSEPYDRTYYLACSGCQKKWHLMAVHHDAIKKMIEESGRDKIDEILSLEAWGKAREIGMGRVAAEGTRYYFQMPETPDICGSVTYFAFIEIKSHIRSFGETLRQLRIYDRIGRDSSAPELSKKNLDITDRDRKRKEIFKGVFLLTPDTRFREEFESQGFKVIPYVIPPKSETRSETRSLDDFEIDEPVSGYFSKPHEDQDIETFRDRNEGGILR